MKVAIYYFEQCGLDPWDYPVEIVEMDDLEFDMLVVDNDLYYDEYMEMYYTPDDSIGYEIIEY